MSAGASLFPSISLSLTKIQALLYLSPSFWFLYSVETHGHHIQFAFSQARSISLLSILFFSQSKFSHSYCRISNCLPELRRRLIRLLKWESRVCAIFLLRIYILCCELLFMIFLKFFPHWCRYVIVGGGNAAGYAARTFVEHGMADGRLCIVTKEVVYLFIWTSKVKMLNAEFELDSFSFFFLVAASCSLWATSFN